MAHFYRLVFAVLALLISGHAYALVNKVPSSYRATSSYFSNGNTVVSSIPAGVCASGTPIYSGWSWRYTAGGTYGSCDTYNSSNVFVQSSPITATSLICPPNSSTSGTSCACNSGFVENGGLCTAPAVDPAAICATLNSGDKKITYPVTNTSTSKSSVYQGVTVTGKTIIYGKLNGAVVPGSQVVYGPFTCAAGSTTSADVPAGGDAAPGPASCKTTEYYGTVNGIPTCVSGALSSTNVVQSIAPTPAGSASNPTSGLGPKAPPGAVSSGTETTCEGSTCKTTTTYKDASGATVGTSEDTQDQPSFCEENPALSICKDSRFSVSNCVAPPACDGDAVQCGIAKLSWQSACALNPTPGAETTLYDSSKGLTGNQTQGASGAPVNLGAGSFSTTDLIGGGGSGMSDLSITVWNTPITLPLSNLNQYLSMFGNVLMAVAFIVAVSIVRGR